MKYFSPSYWFKLWVLSAPLFNSEIQSINAKSIDNKNIKDWASNNTSLESINEVSYTNSSINYWPYNLNQVSNQNINPFYQTNLETSTHKHRHVKSRNRHKRNYYANEEIEFIDNDFFYKFNLNYDSEKKYGSAWTASDFLFHDEKKVIIEDWTRYANNWEEFQQKFPEIEFMNFKCELGGWGDEIETKNNLKISTSNVVLNNWNSDSYRRNFWNFRSGHGKNKDVGNSYLKEVNYSYHKSFLAEHESFVYIVLYLENKKLMINNFLWLQASDSFTQPWGRLRYDSIRLVGEIDMNPLLKLTIEKSKQFDIWATSSEKTLKLKRENINYDKNILTSEEVTFKADFISRLLQIRHDYIQDIINIGQDNKITRLKNEIEDIKSRLDNLEAGKTCLENIFDSFKKNSLSNAPGDVYNKIKKNSDSPIKIIIKKSAKTLATGLLTGVAKGSALGILSCVAESIIPSRKRREIFDINNLEEKNVTKWADEFTKSINNEQHLSIDNKTNFAINNITTL